MGPVVLMASVRCLARGVEYDCCPVGDAAAL
jgi:hypothetical protein